MLLMVIVIMGVTGSGKSTIGRLLADRLSVSFLDADDFHNDENISKMKNGFPLTDNDRTPWLEKISEVLKNLQSLGGVVLACSALKQSYRHVLQNGLKKEITWIHLQGSQSLILSRLNQRKNHFMSPDLLNSQFDILQTPENAYHISIEDKPENIVNEIIKIVEK